MSAAHFDAAVEYVRSLPKDGPVQLDNAGKLKVYGLYKQATEGDVTGSQPWAVQIEARAKWDAWAACKGMSAEDAKAAYVKTIVDIAKDKGHPWVPA